MTSELSVLATLRAERPFRWALLALVSIIILSALAWNAALVRDQLVYIAGTEDGIDYRILASAAARANPYEEPGYLWSPLVAPVLALILPLGLGVWQALHVAALALLRPWWMALAVGLTFPFWWDTASGNAIVFVLIAAWWAVRGSRVGIVAFLALAILIPRPLMLPVLGWLLWQHAWTRAPFVLAAAAHLGIVAGMGLLDDWVVRLTEVLPKEEANTINWAPSHWFGYAPWAAIFLPLSAWLTIKGRLGLAILAACPYVLVYYLLMGFLELRPRPRPSGS